MKNLNLKNTLFALSILLCAISFSCKSSSYTEQQNDQAVAKDTVAQSDINESHEDLMTVDYKQFYDELAPHGEWIEVTSKDLKSEEPTSAGEQSDELNEILKDRSSSFPHMTFSQLFGVNDAVAADVNVGAFFVWRPDPSMAVSISTGTPVVTDEPTVVAAAPMYRPYTNGQWIASDEGWYFKAPTPYEEVVHHYGRWAYSPTMGWVWVPGRVRSPAWVDWREDDDNIAWTPVPPDVYVVNNVIQPVPVYEDRYVVVEKRYFVEPVVYEHVYVDKIKVKGMKKLNGIFVRDRVICNHGPEFTEIERISGRPIAPYKVVTMNEGFKNTWIENNSINTFAPIFTKVKGNKNRNIVVSSPEKFNNFQEVWNRENRNNSAGNKNKVEDIGKQNVPNMDKQQHDNKGMKEGFKENKKEERKKMIDDSKMKYGEKRGNQKFEKREKAPKNNDGNFNKERSNKDKGNKEQPKKEVKRNKEDKQKGNPNKDFKRDKSPGNPKKENRDSRPSGNDRPKDNPKGDKHDKPKKDH
ncbi:MAG: hypothetical protein JST55_05770 [Bacteroidetes bacterium]|nr:hypothetical protein [Bacteroidota bacterium]